MKQFRSADVRELRPGAYWFECAMVTTCRPLFPHDWSNYEVEDDLRSHGVIADCETDTETSALVVNFTSREEGEAFIARLNLYLQQRAAGLDGGE